METISVKKPRKKIIWYKSNDKYAQRETDIQGLAQKILGKKEAELDAMMKSYHKFKEAHSRFGSAMHPKPVRLGKKRPLPEDLVCFGIKGSRLSHKDYQASGKSIGPLAAMKVKSWLGVLAVREPGSEFGGPMKIDGHRTAHGSVTL